MGHEKRLEEALSSDADSPQEVETPRVLDRLRSEMGEPPVPQQTQGVHGSNMSSDMQSNLRADNTGFVGTRSRGNFPPQAVQQTLQAHDLQDSLIEQLPDTQAVSNRDLTQQGVSPINSNAHGSLESQIAPSIA